MNHYILFILVTCAILLKLFWALYRRKDITLSTYRADPDKYNWFNVALSLAGTIVGGGMFLAVGQIGYEAGIAGFFLGLIYFAGLLILAFHTKQIRNMLVQGNHETLIELLRATYNEGVVVIFSVVNLLMYLFLLAAQFVAMLQFSKFYQETTGIIWLPWTIFALAIISVFSYPIIGGLRKDIQTDIIQMILVFLGIFVLFYGIFSQGVELSIWNELKAKHITGTGYGVTFIIGAIIFLTPSFLVRMDIWQRIKASRSDTSAFFGFLVAALLSCFFYVFFTFIGMWAFSSKLTNAKYATLDLVFSQFQDTGSLTFIISAFYAAVFSSADTFINNTSQFLTRIIYPSLWTSNADEQSRKLLLSMLKRWGIGIILASLMLAFFVPDFVDLLVGAFSLLLVFLPTILGLFVKRWQNSVAAFWSSLVALIVFLILFFSWDPKNAFVPAVLISFFIFAVVQRTSKTNGANPNKEDVLQNGA